MVSALRRTQEPGRGANGPIIACFSLLGPAGLPAKLVLLAIGPCKPRVSNAAPLTCDGQRGGGAYSVSWMGLVAARRARRAASIFWISGTKDDLSTGSFSHGSCSSSAAVAR